MKLPQIIWTLLKVIFSTAFFTHSLLYFFTEDGLNPVRLLHGVYCSSMMSNRRVQSKWNYLVGIMYRLGTGGMRLRGLDLSGRSRDDAIVTEAEPRLLLHHPVTDRKGLNRVVACSRCLTCLDYGG